MKKILLVLAMLQLTACTVSPQSGGRPEDVVVDTVMQPYFDDFVKLIQKEKVNIDWTKIHSIEAVPLRAGINGLYSAKTKNIIINWDYRLPRAISGDLNTEQQLWIVKEAAFLILAHEIAHSQGYKHVDEGVNLMSKNDKWLYWAIVNLGREEYTLLTFCN